MPVRDAGRQPAGSHAGPGQDFVARLWGRRRWLMWLPLLVLLLPLAWGQGWIGEVVMTLLPYNEPPSGLAYFFIPQIESTRVLNGLPLALALLTPWPAWVIAAFIVISWLLTAWVTSAVAGRLLPGDRTAALLAFFLAGTSAYDVALLQASYLPLFLGAFLHWCGFLALLRYCENRAAGWLLLSSVLQCMSLATYATAVAAIAIGPFMAIALIAPRAGRRAALRSFAAVAVAWWAPLLAYLGALAWVATLPGNYVTSLGGLSVASPAAWAQLLLRLVSTNFLPHAWLHPFPHFSDPARIIGPAVVTGLAAIAAATMLLLVAGSLRTSRREPAPPNLRWVIALMLSTIIASNMATSLLQGADHAMRTHLVSRLYAAILIAMACAALLHNRALVARASGVAATVAFLAIGAWTVADRGAYLASVWPRQRTELLSFDEIARRIDPKAVIVLYEPPGAGYTATVATWHAFPWLILIRGPRVPYPTFALWSPDRQSGCTFGERELRCTGDMQPPSRMPLDRLVVLRYDKADCRIKLVEPGWTDSTLPPMPPGYAPEKWLRDPPAAVSPLVGKLLYGPQGLGGSFGCTPAAPI